MQKASVEKSFLNRRCWRPDGCSTVVIPEYLNIISLALERPAGAVAGVSYPDVRTGIRAQVQHLKAYACEDALNQDLMDTRFVHGDQRECSICRMAGASRRTRNGGGWAAGSNYGEKLRKLLSNLKAE